MKKLLLLGYALLSFNASAQTELQLPEPGIYAYNGQAIMDLHKHHEVVYVHGEEGKSKLQKLREQEYSCVYKGNNTYLCWKFLSADGENPENEILNKVNNHFQSSTIEIFERDGEPEMITEGESFEEYRLNQPVNIGKKAYAFCRYQVLPNLHKIALGVPAKDGFVIAGNGAYTQIFSFTKTLSKTSYDLYMFTGVFEKK